MSFSTEQYEKGLFQNTDVSECHLQRAEELEVNLLDIPSNIIYISFIYHNIMRQMPSEFCPEYGILALPLGSKDFLFLFFYISELQFNPLLIATQESSVCDIPI